MKFLVPNSACTFATEYNLVDINLPYFYRKTFGDSNGIDLHYAVKINEDLSFVKIMMAKDFNGDDLTYDDRDKSILLVRKRYKFPEKDGLTVLNEVALFDLDENSRITEDEFELNKKKSL